MAPPWPKHFCLKEAIRSLRFGECDTIADAAEVYGVSQASIRKEASLCGLTFKEREAGDSKGTRGKTFSGQRFTDEEEKEIVREVLKEGFEATHSEILALANSKLGEDNQVAKSWVTSFLNRNPEAREAIDQRRKRLEEAKPKPKPRSTRPNAANRKFTEEEEDELEDRILDSNCNCYEDMVVLAEELLEELGQDDETISTHWMYAFVKRHPDCKEIITERSGGSYIGSADSIWTRAIYTYNDHIHMGRLKEAKNSRQDIENGKDLFLQTDASGEYWPNSAEILVEIYKRRKEFEDIVTQFLGDPVIREGEEIFVPIMPRDFNDMIALMGRVRADLIKQHANQETGSSAGNGPAKVGKAENGPAKAKKAGDGPTKMRKAAKVIEQQPVEHVESQEKKAGPSPEAQKKVHPWKCRAMHAETAPYSESGTSNRKLTKEQEEELVCRIMDSDCRSYTDMQLLAEDLVEEIDEKKYEIISDNWVYAFVKRHAECKEKIKEKGGLLTYYEDINEPRGLGFRKRKVPTHHVHPHWDQLQQAKKIWDKIYMVQEIPDDMLEYCCVDESEWATWRIYIEIGKRVQDGRYGKTAVLGLLPDPAPRLGSEYVIPILPADPHEMAALIQRVKDDVTKERQAAQEAEAPVLKEAEDCATKVTDANKGKKIGKQSTEQIKSPMKAIDPNKRIAPTQAKGTKKRARQEDKENEAPMLVDSKGGKAVKAEKPSEQGEVLPAPKRQKQAKQKEWDPIKACKQAKGAAWSPTEAYEQFLKAQQETSSMEKTAPAPKTAPASKPAVKAGKSAGIVKQAASSAQQVAPRRSMRSTKGVKK